MNILIVILLFLLGLFLIKNKNIENYVDKSCDTESLENKVSSLNTSVAMAGKNVLKIEDKLTQIQLTLKKI